MSEFRCRLSEAGRALFTHHCCKPRVLGWAYPIADRDLFRVCWDDVATPESLHCSFIDDARITPTPAAEVEDG